jgi:hypothetical protein
MRLERIGQGGVSPVSVPRKNLWGRQQLQPCPVKPDRAQEFDRPLVNIAPEMPFQGAAQHATRGGETINGPGTRRARLEKVDRLLHISRKQSRKHRSPHAHE